MAKITKIKLPDENTARDIYDSEAASRLDAIESTIGDASAAGAFTLAFEGTYDQTDNKIATKSYVDGAISSLIDEAPDELNTLKELADALNNDDDFHDTINTLLNDKVDKVEGKGLSTNDYDATEKSKVTTAYNHATSPHAPVTAQANIIESIKINNTALTITDKSVNIVPNINDLEQTAGDMIIFNCGSSTVNV